MINESIKRLHSHNRSADWMEKELHNGKVKCFVCQKDQLKNDESIEDSDLQGLFLKSRVVYFQNLGANKPQTSSADFLVLKSNLSNILISPCQCARSVHPKCLINYSVMNISFQCAYCKANYGVGFAETVKEQRTRNVIFIFLLFFCLHIILLLTSLLFFINYFDFSKKRFFWGIILGTLLMMLNLFIMRYSIKYVNMLLLQRKHLEPIFSNNADCKEELKQITSDKGEEMYRFLKARNKCSKLDLLEKKINNVSLRESIAQDEKRKLQLQIINSNNKPMLKLKPFTGETASPNILAGSFINLIKPKAARRQMSYNNLVKFRPPLDKLYGITKSRGNSHREWNSDTGEADKGSSKSDNNNNNNNNIVTNNSSTNRRKLFLKSLTINDIDKKEGSFSPSVIVKNNFNNNMFNNSLQEIEEENEPVKKDSVNTLKNFHDVRSPMHLKRSNKSGFNLNLDNLNNASNLNITNNPNNISTSSFHVMNNYMSSQSNFQVMLSENREQQFSMKDIRDDYPSMNSHRQMSSFQSLDQVIQLKVKTHFANLKNVEKTLSQNADVESMAEDSVKNYQEIIENREEGIEAEYKIEEF